MRVHCKSHANALALISASELMGLIPVQNDARAAAGVL
jgi:hypothetical protein